MSHAEDLAHGLPPTARVTFVWLEDKLAIYKFPKKLSDKSNNLEGGGEKLYTIKRLPPI